MREEDAQTITEYNSSKISVFGCAGNGFGYKNTSVHFEKDAEQKRKAKEALSQIEIILHKLDENILSNMYQIISGSTLNLDDGGNIKNILIDIYKKNKEKLSANNPLSYFFDDQPAEIDGNSKLDGDLLFVELFKEFKGVLSKKLGIKVQVEQLKDTFQRNLDSSLVGLSIESSFSPVVMPNVVSANRDFIMINGDARAEGMIVGGGSNSQDTIIFTGTVSPGVFHIENSVIHQHVNKPTFDKAALDSKEADALKQLKAGYSTLEYTDIKGIFGSFLKFEGQYINLQILCTDLKIKKPEEDNKESKEFAKAKPDEKYKDARMASVEDLFGDKRAVKAEDLFKPTRALFDKALETDKDADEAPRLLLVQGRAGIGKTTFVHYVAHKWSQGQLYANYTWVFSLTLRKLRLLPNTPELSLPEWIKQSQFSSWSPKEFFELWEQRIEPAIYQNKVLLILDGYDETPENHPCQSVLKDLLRGHSPNLSLLITTRPSSAQDITDKRRNLEIIGFTDENINQYIQSYFSKVPNKTLVDTLTEILRKQPVIWANAHIPLNLNLLCGIVDEAIKKTNAEGLTQVLTQLSSMTRLYQVMEKKLYERAHARHDSTPFRIGAQLMISQQPNYFIKRYQKERLFLAKLAFQSFDTAYIIIPKETVTSALWAYVDEQIREDSQKKIQREEDGPILGGTFFEKVGRLGLIKPILDARHLSQTDQDYEFLHLTFQEYYTAIYLAEAFSSQESTLQAFAQKIISKEKYNPRWQIVWWFTAGFLSENTPVYEVYLQQLQGQSASQKDMLEHYQLGLLTRCVDEGLNPQNQHVVEPIVKQLQLSFLKLYQMAKNVTNNNDKYIVGKPALIKSPFFSAYRISPNLCMSKQQDLYALILEPSKREDKWFFLAWIGNIRVVTPKVLDALVSLLADEDHWTRRSAAYAVANLGTAATPKLLNVLAELLVTEHGWQERIGMGATVTPELLEALPKLLSYEDEDSEVYGSAASPAVRKRDKTAMPRLLSAFPRVPWRFVYSDREAMRHAAEAVGNLGAAATPKLLDALLESLADEDWQVRSVSAEALDRLSGIAATPAFLRQLLVEYFVQGNDKALSIFEMRIDSVFMLMPPFWTENADHYNMLAFVSYTLAAAYLSGCISCQIDCDQEVEPPGYYMRGFVEKSRYCFLITEAQAQSLWRLSSLIIEQLSKTGSLDILELKRQLPEWEKVTQSVLLSKQRGGNVKIHLPGNLGSASEQKGSPLLTPQYQQDSRRASEARGNEARTNQNHKKVKSMCGIS